MENATIETNSTSKTPWVGEGNEDTNQYWDVKQELKLPVIGWLDGKTLGCRIDIKDSAGYNAIPDAPEEKLNTNITFFVEGRFSQVDLNLTFLVQLRQCPQRRMRSIQKATLKQERRESLSFTFTPTLNQLSSHGEPSSFTFQITIFPCYWYFLNLPEIV